MNRRKPAGGKRAAATRRPASRPAATNKVAAKKSAAGKPRARPRPVLELEPTGPVAYEGGCHCGAIAYTYLTALPARRWPVRLCQCSFCRGHGIRATSDAAGELHFRFERPEFLRRYRFALRTADYLICKECGTCVAAVILSGRGAQGSVNLNTLRQLPPGVPAGTPVSRDGEGAEMRRARRAQTWTPVVGPV